MRKIITLIIAALFFVMAISAFAADAPLLISPNPNAEAAEGTENKEAEPEMKFTDLAQDVAYKEAIEKLVKNGVLNGYPDGTIKPVGNLTRAEMCKMINLTFGYTSTEGATGFTDLKENEWYVPFVLAAQKAGYVQGDPGGAFRPNDKITRQEVCAILYRVIKPYDLPIPVVINDKVDDWAKVYVEAIVKNSLMPLEEGGLFRATEPIKRHELASALAPHSNVKVDEIKCKLTLKNGEEILSAEAVIGKGVENFPVPSKIPEGFAFAGWSLVENQDQTVDSKYIFYQDTTLYAYFVLAEYEVKFISGEKVISTQKIKHGEKATAPEAPKPQSGYTFVGWVVDGTTDIIDITKYEVKSNVIFKATYKSDAAGGGFGGGGFGGGGGGGGGGETPSEPEVTITFNVYFKVNGSIYDTQTVEEGKTPSKPSPNPTVDGYTFAGWALTEDGEAVTVSNQKIEAETTFYAIFTLDEDNPNDEGIVDAIYNAISQFNGMRLTNINQQEVRTIMVDTMQKVYDEAVEGVYIDSDYVKEHYLEELEDVEWWLGQEETESNTFITAVSNSVDPISFDLLVKFFLSEETQNKYLGK